MLILLLKFATVLLALVLGARLLYFTPKDPTGYPIRLAVGLGLILWSALVGWVEVLRPNMGLLGIQ